MRVRVQPLDALVLSKPLLRADFLERYALEALDCHIHMHLAIDRLEAIGVCAGLTAQKVRAGTSGTEPTCNIEGAGIVRAASLIECPDGLLGICHNCGVDRLSACL